MDREKLVPMPIEYLFVDFVLPESIYDHTGNVMLLRGGERLTEHSIDRLLKFNSGQNRLLVRFSTLETLLKQSGKKELLQQKLLEFESGYADFSGEVENLLKEVQETNMVVRHQVASLQCKVTGALRHGEIGALLQCIDAPRPMDEDLQRHCTNVAVLNGLMGMWLGLSEFDIDELVLAGLMHDIGKTKTPREILDAPRKLTAAEYTIMKEHALHSYDLLAQSETFSVAVCEAARGHHESVGGDGYPDGLRGDDISLFAKITAISDVYDALVSKRSYKNAKSAFLILAEMAEGRYSQLAPELVQVFVRKLPQQFLGKQVVLNDGSTGQVCYTPPNDVGYPILLVNGEVKQTKSTWYCTRLLIDNLLETATEMFSG